MQRLKPKSLALLLVVVQYCGSLLVAQQAQKSVLPSPFSNAEIVWDKAANTPRQIRFVNSLPPSKETFFEAYRNAFGLSEQNTFRLVREERGSLGQTHSRYAQYYKGIEVADMQYLLHSRQDKVSLAHGNIIAGLDINITPSITAQQARTLALHYLGISAAIQNTSRISGDERISLMQPEQQPQLMISAGDKAKIPENFHLVYRIDIVAQSPLRHFDVDIDAHTGELVGKIDRVYTENIPVRAYSLYNDSVDIVLSDTGDNAVWQTTNTHWHPDNYMAYGGEGTSWWVADTGFFDFGVYNVFWYECLQTDPVIVHGENPKLSFFQRYSVETPAKTVSGYDGYDGLNVRISVDHGATWQVLKNPFPVYTCKSLFGFGYNYGEDQGVPGWSGKNEEWTNASFNLSNYIDDTVMIRFAFCSDELNSTYNDTTWFGWQIDNISVSSSEGQLYFNDGSPGNISVKSIKNLGNGFQGKYRLRETSRGTGIATINTRRGSKVNNFADYTENSLPVDSMSPEGVSLHFGMEKTYDYYTKKFGRNSYDDKGSVMIGYANWTVNKGRNNAAWYGDFGAFGSGDSVNVLPLVSVDIVGHEITHGVTDHSCGLIYAGESGALNESFSDIFGTAIEFYALGYKGNWLMAEGPFVATGGLRSLKDPNLFKHPDTYLGKFWLSTNNPYDQGGVHINSGVQNHWFYLLSEGGTGTNDDDFKYSVSGIGIDNAAQIAYRNLTEYLMPSSGYTDAAVYSLQSAIDLFGERSGQAKAVVDAWNAVGIYFTSAIKVPDTLEFYCDLNSQSTKKMEINSKGTESLHISNIEISGEGFSVSDLPELPLEVDQAVPVTVSLTFKPSQMGNTPGMLTIYSNDADEPVRKVYLSGNTIGPANIENTPAVSTSAGLSKAYPNPFSTNVVIPFEISDEGHVMMYILNSSGEIIRTLANSDYLPGIHSVTWNGYDAKQGLCPAGNYFIVMHAQGQIFTQTITRL